MDATKALVTKFASKTFYSYTSRGHVTFKLEVEDEEKRQQRIGNLLEQLNSSSSSRNTSNTAPPAFDFGERKTHPVDPPSELLARIQDFLPRLKAENDSLAQRLRDNPLSVDIENIEEDAEQYIEMNLGLGVLETRPKDSNSNSFSPSHSDDEESESTSEEDSSSSSSSSPDTTSSESDSEDDSDSDSSSNSNSSMRIKAIASRPIKPIPRRVAKSDVDILPDPPSAG